MLALLWHLSFPFDVGWPEAHQFCTGLNWLHSGGAWSAQPACLPRTSQQSASKGSGFAGKRMWQKNGGCGRRAKAARTIGYDVAEVSTAERLDLERICAALPSEGWVVWSLQRMTARACLVLKTNAQEDERPRDPMVWVQMRTGRSLQWYS